MKKVIDVARVNWICFRCLGGIPKGTQYEMHRLSKRRHKRYCKKCAIKNAS